MKEREDIKRPITALSMVAVQTAQTLTVLFTNGVIESIQGMKL